MRFSRRVCLGLLACVFCAGAFSPVFPCAWGGEGGARYVNARYGFSVLLPKGHVSFNEPDNGDGATFRYPEGMVVRVYGTLSPSVMDRDCKATFENDSQSFDTLTYKRLNEKKNWFVLSGYKEGDIRYMKCFVGKTAAYVIDMQYPREQASRYDGFVRAAAGSFSPGTLQ